MDKHTSCQIVLLLVSSNPLDARKLTLHPETCTNYHPDFPPTKCITICYLTFNRSSGSSISTCNSPDGCSNHPGETCCSNTHMPRPN